MDISDRLRCLFSATVDEQDDSYVIEVPKREVDLGNVRTRGTYRVAVLPSPGDGPENGEAAGRSERPPDREEGPPAPPVEEGERRTVEIDDIGEQGDGITRVERGFVVIVPDTEQGERVRIEITDVKQTVAFAEVVERISYYE